MGIWNRGGLSGHDERWFELTGKVVGQRPGFWRFDDGERVRWLPKENIMRYRSLGGGYFIVTIPQWLARQPNFRPKMLHTNNVNSGGKGSETATR